MRHESKSDQFKVLITERKGGEILVSGLSRTMNMGDEFLSQTGYILVVEEILEKRQARRDNPMDQKGIYFRVRCSIKKPDKP